MVFTVVAQGFSAASFALDAYNKIDKVVDACGKVKETVSIEGALLPSERVDVAAQGIFGVAQVVDLVSSCIGWLTGSGRGVQLASQVVASVSDIGRSFSHQYAIGQEFDDRIKLQITAKALNRIGSCWQAAHSAYPGVCDSQSVVAGAIESLGAIGEVCERHPDMVSVVIDKAIAFVECASSNRATQVRGLMRLCPDLEPRPAAAQGELALVRRAESSADTIYPLRSMMLEVESRAVARFDALSLTGQLEEIKRLAECPIFEVIPQILAGAWMQQGLYRCSISGVMVSTPLIPAEFAQINRALPCYEKQKVIEWLSRRSPGEAPNNWPEQLAPPSSLEHFVDCPKRAFVIERGIKTIIHSAQIGIIQQIQLQKTEARRRELEEIDRRAAARRESWEIHSANPASVVSSNSPSDRTGEEGSTSSNNNSSEGGNCFFCTIQ